MFCSIKKPVIDDKAVKLKLCVANNQEGFSGHHKNKPISQADDKANNVKKMSSNKAKL